MGPILSYIPYVELLRGGLGAAIFLFVLKSGTKSQNAHVTHLLLDHLSITKYCTVSRVAGEGVWIEKIANWAVLLVVLYLRHAGRDAGRI